ncbi:pyridoxamine 5'-phosphate oxidase family protein [Cellulosimicrobium marinum]|uniref:pyridoxamine 5'-phosphate oxidase family protein n=1 Tax=Cellulosimicrobium marinum TaxID=1638992 RepID=UPI001E3EAE20|nr:pyridoxamine 5'-phosphate oxidase family protein [Cellulosimicrobium marinum]MCB7135917.1 pyridoxamine 5'-phosphate oxidase family protein [Cellulosimicrobium marinum]
MTDDACTTPAAPGDPEGTLVPHYSSPGARPVPWAAVRTVLERAEISWISTVRPDGRPHVTPLMTVVADGCLHVTTGPEERKARNLADNPRVVLTTGTNAYVDALDVVVEGEAVRVTDDATLHRLAERWRCKYGDEWAFTVHDGAFSHPDGGVALVFAVRPEVVFAYERTAEHAAMRWRFDDGPSA